MNLTELKAFHSIITQYSKPEELFGQLNDLDIDKQKKRIRDIYKDLIIKYHPDLYTQQGDASLYYSGQISGIINELKDRALQKIDAYSYGKPELSDRISGTIFTIKTGQTEYRVIKHWLETDFSNIYYGEHTKSSNEIEKVCIKIAINKEDGYLFKNEVVNLGRLGHKSIPVLIDNFRTTENQEATITRWIDGYDLITLRERYPDGIPLIHACWIMDRLLSVLGHIHYNVIVHGNIEPGNILVRPFDHNAFIIDFIFSVANPVINDIYKGSTEFYSAPEVFSGKNPIPHSDIYSMGKVFVFMLGGNLITNELPVGIDNRIKPFLQKMLHPEPLERNGDAWILWHELSQLRLQIFGNRHQFVEFKVP